MLPDAQENHVQSKKEAWHFIQTALDALSAHIAILDQDGYVIGVNAAWREFADINSYNDPMYGVGTNYLGVCDASAERNSQDAIFVAAGIRSVLSGDKQEFELEYPCHSPTQKRWFVVRISRFEWYQGVRLIVAHQNVTELKRIQLELIENYHRLESILDNVNNGIITIDRQGIIETANQAASKIFGYYVDEMIGTSLETLIEEKINQKTLKKWDGISHHEIQGCKKDQSKFPISIAVSELKLTGGTYYACIIQDITLRKQIEAEKIERERLRVALEKERELWVLKNRFLSMMGHELNTPLTAISLSYDMLKKYRHRATEEENEQALDNIHQQVGHLREMVKDVMTLSRSEVDQLSIEPEDIDLITYCRDVVEEFQFTFHRSHQVIFECEENDIRGQIDRRMLRRALTNLLSNAIKYSPDGGEIRFVLAVNKQEDHILIQVSDAGIGIPEEDHGRLFEPFHRADNVDKLPGTGLGLAIVKQTVDLHGGQISFESSLGSGSTFIIELPLHHT